MKLDFFQQERAFFKLKADLKSNAVALYFALLHIANASSHEGGINQSFRVDNERLMHLSGIASKKTLVSIRNVLCQRGFIDYQSGGRFVDGRRNVGLYTLKKLY